jgi:hypothetical protein
MDPLHSLFPFEYYHLLLHLKEVSSFQSSNQNFVNIYHFHLACYIFLLLILLICIILIRLGEQHKLSSFLLLGILDSCCHFKIIPFYSAKEMYWNLLTPWSRDLKKLTGPQLLNKFPAFYGTRRFITAFTTTRHLSLPWARTIQSMLLIPLL